MARRFFLFGIVFGFVLSRAQATSYDAIANMFLLRDLHLMGVIGVAVVVAGVGLAILGRRPDAGCGDVGPRLSGKSMHPGIIPGSLLFGAGWAITGTCPGTALAQLGELQLTAIFTLTGIVGGAALFRRFPPGPRN